MHQGQVETVKEKLTSMLKAVTENEACLVTSWRDYSELVALYRCTAEGNEEEECKGFVAGVNGQCAFKVLKYGMETCEWREK